MVEEREGIVRETEKSNPNFAVKEKGSCNTGLVQTGKRGQERK